MKIIFSLYVFTFVFFLLLVVGGCAKKVPVPLKNIVGNGYVAVETSPGMFIMAANDAVRDAAVNAICTREYICAQAAVGVVIEIERIKK